MRSFVLMVQFMTRYPVPVEIDFSVSRFVEGMKWMPLVGLLVGLPGALSVVLLTSLLGQEVAVLFAIIMMICVTGGLHLDGIGDTADGLFSYRSKERVLEIMRDSTLGTNGVIAVVLIILLKFILLKNLPIATTIIALLTAPIIGRMAITWHAAFSKYAREGEGMGGFVEQVTPGSALAATGLSFILSVVLFFVVGISWHTGVLFLLVLHLTTIGWALLFARYLQKRIDGITGDTIGTTIEISEVITFIFYLLAWNYIS